MKIKLGALAALALSAILTACGGGDPTVGNDPTPPTSPPATPPVSPPPTEQDPAPPTDLPPPPAVVTGPGTEGANAAPQVTGATGNVLDSRVYCRDNKTTTDPATGDLYWYDTVEVPPPTILAAPVAGDSGVVGPTNTQNVSFRADLWVFYDGQWLKAGTTPTYFTQVVYPHTGADPNVMGGQWFNSDTQQWESIGAGNVAEWPAANPDARYEVWFQINWYANDKVGEGQVYGRADPHLWENNHTQYGPDHDLNNQQYHCPGNKGWAV